MSVSSRLLHCILWCVDEGVSLSETSVIPLYEGNFLYLFWMISFNILQIVADPVMFSSVGDFTVQIWKSGVWMNQLKLVVGFSRNKSLIVYI